MYEFHKVKIKNIQKELFQIYKPKDAQSKKIALALKTHLKDVGSFEEFSKRSPMAENVVRKLYPDMNNIFNKKLKTPRDGAKVLQQIVELTNDSLQNYKLDMKLDAKKAVKLFYEIYGYMIKLLISFNIAAAAYTVGPTITVSLAVIITCCILYNASVHDVTPQQAWKNFKKSFFEFLKRNIPTKAERNLAIVPVIILSLIMVTVEYIMGAGSILALLYTGVKIGMGVGTLALGGSAGAVATGAAIFLLGWYLKGAMFFYITEVIEEWTLRKGEGNPQEV
jgi:hypothetical protein